MSPYLFELDSENEELTLHHLTNPCLVPLHWELYVSANLGQGPLRSGLQSSLAQMGLAGMLKGFCTGKELQGDLKWESGALRMFSVPCIPIESAVGQSRTSKELELYLLLLFL